MLSDDEIEDLAMMVLIRELHKGGVSFQTINKALAGASAELARDVNYAPALSIIRNGVELIGILADAHSETARSQ